MKNHIKTASLLGAIALLSGCVTPQNPAQAAPTLITTAQGRGADLNVRGGGFANSNFGDFDILRVRNSRDLGGARKTYLRFDLATLTAPAKQATGAALGLRIVPAEGKSPGGKVWTFNVSGLVDAIPEEEWSESRVNWNNAPASDPSSPLDLTADAVPLGTFTITGEGVVGEQIAFSSPEFLKFLKADTNGIVTLIITRQEASDGAGNDVAHIFAAKEYATPAPPVLSVAFNGEAPLLPKAQTVANVPAAPKPLPFENEIKAFEAADRQNPPAKGGVLFVGSSSIRMWATLKQDFPGQPVFNRGFGGSKISDSVNFVDRIVTPYEPKMIVFYAGTNDIADGKSPETIMADYLTFVSRVRAKLPNTAVAFIAVAPAPSRWNKREEIKRVNSLVEEFSKLAPNTKFIDIYPLMLDANGQPRPELFLGDQLHMNAQGYAIWKQAVAPFLPKP